MRTLVGSPNLLQNLLGEGTLSASFVPVYSRLRAEGRALEASRTAAVIAALLGLLVTTLVAAGILMTPWLVTVLAPGFTGTRRDTTVLLVRILFPGIGILVLSAWCLGVLSSHRRFWLSYSAPLLWNLAQIGVLLIAGQYTSGYRLAEWVAWGAVFGSLLQLAVQLPGALWLLGRFRPRWEPVRAEVRQVARAFVPAVVGRGVVQLSAYVDSILASLLPIGAVAALGYAQILYTLPVSLFGMAISAAELPEMSSLLGARDEVSAALRQRLEVARLRVALFVIPAAVGFMALGDALVALCFQTGRFGRQDTVYVWMILAGSAPGLLAVTLGRLYASAFYALGDPRTPLRFSLLRLGLTAGVGWLGALVLPGWLGLPARWGAAGLTASTGLAGCVEYLLLRRELGRRIGTLGGDSVWRLWLAAAIGAGATWALRLLLEPRLWTEPLLANPLWLVTYAACYAMLAGHIGPEPAVELRRRLVRRMTWHAPKGKASSNSGHHQPSRNRSQQEPGTKAR